MMSEDTNKKNSSERRSAAVQFLSTEGAVITDELTRSDCPLEFSTFRFDGTYGNSWSLNIDSGNCVVMYCSDNPLAERVTFNRPTSRNPEILSLDTQNLDSLLNVDDFFTHKVFDSSHIASCNLIFAPLGQGLDQSSKNKGLGESTIVILCPRNEFIVVSIYIVPKTTRLLESKNIRILARVGLDDDTILYVLVSQYRTKEFFNWIDHLSSKQDSTLRENSAARIQPSRGFHGYLTQNDAFLVSLPVRYASTETELVLQETVLRRRKVLEILAER